MKAIRLRAPASLENLYLDTSAATDPGPGEIKVRLRAASLNFRDGLVVNGFFPVRDGLIPLSDGAGEVVAVGAQVSEFAVGDTVVSTFHPNWLNGHMERAELNNSPGGPAFTGCYGGQPGGSAQFGRGYGNSRHQTRGGQNLPA